MRKTMVCMVLMFGLSACVKKSEIKGNIDMVNEKLVAVQAIDCQAKCEELKANISSVQMLLTFISDKLK